CFVGNPGLAGLGGIFRTNLRDSFLSYSGPVGTANSIKGETLVLLEGQKIFVHSRDDTLEVEGDFPEHQLMDRKGGSVLGQLGKFFNQIIDFRSFSGTCSEK
ncbi:hypothetical protein AMTR_s00040p00143550, partial [Amborella trichopoda]